MLSKFVCINSAPKSPEQDRKKPSQVRLSTTEDVILSEPHLLYSVQQWETPKNSKHHLGSLCHGESKLRFSFKFRCFWHPVRPWTGLSGGVSVHHTLIYQDWQVRATFAVGSTSSASFTGALSVSDPPEMVSDCSTFHASIPSVVSIQLNCFGPYYLFLYHSNINDNLFNYVLPFHSSRRSDFFVFLWISVILLQ